MLKTEITVSAKKGDSQKTTWLVHQNYPYPFLCKEGYKLDWTNFESIFPYCGRKADGIGHNYVCDQLSTIATQEDIETLNPGAIQFRGKSLGEFRVEFDELRPGQEPCPRIQVRGFKHPTPVEREFINGQIIPKLVEFIFENSVELKNIAVAACKKRMATVIEETRNELNAAERKIGEAIW